MQRAACVSLGSRYLKDLLSTFIFEMHETGTIIWLQSVMHEAGKYHLVTTSFGI